MNRNLRVAVFVTGVVGIGLLWAVAVGDVPGFGRSEHTYRDHAVHAALSRETANVVSSINFDQRGFDTLGEETMLLAAVVGIMSLLRPATEERELRPAQHGRVLDATRLVGYLLLPVTLVVGFDIVVHGTITPGGGFQGGVLLATGPHLLYVAGSYRALDRLRPVNAFDVAEAVASAAFVVVGVAGTVAAGAFLANFLPVGTLGTLTSAGTVPLLNVAVGIAVAAGLTVLLAQFLAQEITIVPKGESRR